MMTYPSKVERLLREVREVGSEPWHGRPWENIRVEQNPEISDALYFIRAERPGNVFVGEQLSLTVAASPGYVIPGTDIKMRATQRFMGGSIYRFGEIVKIGGWKQLNRID